MKDVLLVSDMAGVGKVALSAMIPVLSTMDVNVHNLATAMISNNFGYGEAEIYDLTKYMENTEKVWKKLGFQFDIVTTGIIMNKEQVDIIKKIIENQKEKPLVITDPIMGDGGKIYPGLPKDILEAMRAMVPLADILIPNSTEAALILGEEHPEDYFEIDQIEDWIEKLVDRGSKAVVITSAKTNQGHFVFGYSEKEGMFRVEYEHLPILFGGTGDIFSSLLTGKLAKGYELKEAVEYAVKVLSSILKEESKKGKDMIIHIPIEEYLQGLEHLEKR